MKTSTLLGTGFAIAIGYFGSTACVARECTGEEQQEVGATGADECETLTLPVQHRGDAEAETLEYTTGTNLVVNGDFRNLEIEAFPNGGTGEIEVQYTPVVDLAEGRSQEVVDATLAEIEVTVSEASGAITVNAVRDSDSNVAALIQVRIPDDFDGDITIEQDGDKNDAGEAELTFLGNSRNLRVDLNASGETLTVKGADLETAVISVNGFWDIATDSFVNPNFSGATLTAQNGDITTGFAAVPTGADVQVTSEDGDLSVRLPGEGNYTMQADSADFSFAGDIPPTCLEATNEGGGSMTCGDGGGDNQIDYYLVSGGSIEIPGFLALSE